MADRFIKVFGERNTGTRAVIGMLNAMGGVSLRPIHAPAILNLPQHAELRANIDRTLTGKRRRHYRDAVLDMEHMSACPTLAWKHAAPMWAEAFVRHNANVIFMIRNPYSWLISLAKTPYHRHDLSAENLENFVQTPWLTMLRDNLAPILTSPVELWNRKASAYLMFQKHAKAAGVDCRVLRFEDFVAAPDEILSQALDGFAIARHNLTGLARSTKNPDVELSDLARRYKAEHWKSELGHDAVRLINARLDWDIVEKFGYERLKSEDFIMPMPTSKNLCRTHNLTSHSGSQLQT